MQKIHDLSAVIEEDMWSYNILPGLEETVPEIRITGFANIEEQGFFFIRIQYHRYKPAPILKAGSHMIKGEKNLDDYEINDFIKRAVIIRTGRLNRKELINREMIESSAPEIQEGEAVIVDTGWYRFLKQTRICA